jgi:hypothetical protein
MLIERMIRAARLDPGLYNEVEQDDAATGQAAGVVLIVAVCAAIGGAMSANRTHSLIGAGINAVVLWLLLSFVILVVGRLLGGTADFGEVMRTLAFAHTPGVLALFTFIPILGELANVAAWVWTLLATIVAVREAMDFDTGRAVITVMLPTIILIAVAVVAGLVFGLGIAALILLGH